MRVLYVNSGNLYGGVESLLVTLARERGLCPEVEPAFAACFRGRMLDELRAAGVLVHLLGEVRVRRPWSVWQARRRLAEFLRREPFDAVVCHAAWVQAIFGPVVRAAGRPLVFWLHDPPNARLHWLEHWAAQTRPDLAVCNSRYTLDRLPRLYPDLPGEVVYCPVSPPEALPSAAERAHLRATLDTPPEAVVVVQVGRWAMHKGHRTHLEALARLRDLPGWVCWQLGGPQGNAEGAYFGAMRRLAAELGIADRVRFPGWQPEVRRLVAAADVYCQPNDHAEPFGIAFVEALYAGLPVVTAALGGAVEIVDETCGRRVAARDVPALVDALRGLIEDETTRRQLGSAGPARAAGLCDPATQTRHLAHLLRGVGRAERTTRGLRDPVAQTGIPPVRMS
jgi:glycosyltransferase involved in cell wall biosynthesis